MNAAHALRRVNAFFDGEIGHSDAKGRYLPISMGDTPHLQPPKPAWKCCRVRIEMSNLAQVTHVSVINGHAAELYLTSFNKPRGPKDT